MNLNHFYHYYKSKSGGVSNLLLGSEELDQSDQGEWVRYNMNAVNANVPGVANPLSSDETVEQLDFEASTVARIAQTVTLTAGTEYTFSVWARAASGTAPFRLRYWDNVGGSGGGSAFTASATWSASTGRYEMTFTAANSGTFQMFIQNAGGTAVSRRIYFWGAMLNVGASALDYVKTEFPTGPSNPPTAPMEFGDNFAGVTAYYSLRRFTKGEDNNAIRVRRSSDDTEQDIGFDANGDLDSTALLAFVNEEHTIADEDFSSSTGWTLATGVSIADGVLRFSNSSSGSAAYNPFGEYDRVGIKIRVSFTISNYSGSGTIQFIKFGTGVSFVETGNEKGTARNADGTYIEELTFAGTFSSNSRWGFATSGNFTGDVDDFQILQITADGAVTTWYDQSGNGNDATNATASEQPLIVSGGSVVTENGKAAVEFDGGDNLLVWNNITAPTLFQDMSDAISVLLVEKATVISNSSGSWFNGHTIFELRENSNASGTGVPFSIGYSNSKFGFGVTSDYLSENELELSSTITSAQRLSTSFVNGDDLDVYLNSSSAINTTFTTATGDRSIGSGNSTLAIGCRSRDGGDADTNYFLGTMQEIVLYKSDQSTNRTGIESNVNDHFSIYP